MTIKPLSPLILSAALLFSACGAESGNNASKADLQQKLGAFEKKLETMKTLPDGPASAKQQLSNLMKMGKGAPDPIGQFVVEAVCAGLVSIDANDLYAKIRPSLRDIQSFENEVLETCPACSGTGGSSVECLQCHGSGKCPIPSCEDGKREVPSLAGSSGMVVSCSTCKGTGKCPTCQGKGEHPVRCSKCHGTRRVINKNAARELYQIRIAAAIAECQSKQGKTVQPVPMHVSSNRTTTPVESNPGKNTTGNNSSDDLWSDSDSDLFGNRRSTPKSGSGRWIEARTLSSAEAEKLLETLQYLSNDNYLVEDVISACKTLIDIQPTDEIRKALGRCWTIGPFEKAKDAKDFATWRKLIAEVEQTATTIQSKRSEASLHDRNLLFDWETYVRKYCGSNATDLQKQRVFKTLWEQANPSKTLKDFCRASYVPIPKGMKFVVKDVELIGRNDGAEVYGVSVEPLVYGEENWILDKKWVGDPVQTELFCKIVEATGGIGRSLFVPTSRTEVETWAKGTIIESDKWIVQWVIVWAEVTYRNGTQGERREILCGGSDGTMFRRNPERMELE